MMYEYGAPRIQVINRRCDGTIIPDEEMDGMVIPVNEGFEGYKKTLQGGRRNLWAKQSLPRAASR